MPGIDPTKHLAIEVDYRRCTDMRSKRFGFLHPLFPVGRTKNGNVTWMCFCECGNYTIKDAGNMSRYISCGCAKRKTAESTKLWKSDQAYNNNRAIRRKSLIEARMRDGFVGFAHGELKTYRSGCRCDKCRQANATAARTRKRELRKDEVKRQCGTDVAYLAGCRCEKCRLNYVVNRRSWIYKVDKADIKTIASVESMECEICDKKLSGKDWVIDHCHKTGSFRGVLCRKCNSGLGQFYDKEESILLAIEYLSCPPAERIGRIKTDADVTLARELAMKTTSSMSMELMQPR